MTETYAGHGLQFRYPAEWELDEQHGDDQVALTLSSPQTAFWTLVLHFDQPDPRVVLETVLKAFRDEYPELDIYPSEERLQDQPTLARDIDFVCHDLLNSAWVRVFETDEFTAVVLYQSHDRELDEYGPILEGITKSLEWTA